MPKTYELDPQPEPVQGPDESSNDFWCRRIAHSNRQVWYSPGHRLASYEGDGDPGCRNLCPGCQFDAMCCTIDKLRHEVEALKMRCERAERSSPVFSKFAIFSPADQTFVYLTKDGSITTEHTEVHLYDDLRSAQMVIEMFKRNDPLDRPPMSEDLYIEEVRDEEEFRSRPPTW